MRARPVFVYGCVRTCVHAREKPPPPPDPDAGREVIHTSIRRVHIYKCACVCARVCVRIYTRYARRRRRRPGVHTQFTITSPGPPRGYFIPGSLVAVPLLRPPVYSAPPPLYYVRAYTSTPPVVPVRPPLTPLYRRPLPPAAARPPADNIYGSSRRYVTKLGGGGGGVGCVTHSFSDTW